MTFGEFEKENKALKKENKKFKREMKKLFEIINVHSKELEDQKNYYEKKISLLEYNLKEISKVACKIF